MRPTRAHVDLGAVRHNVGLLAGVCAPAALCAVVKADGYGHGSIAVARAALDAGVQWLAVALVEEAAVLRRAGIDVPIMLLGQPAPLDLPEALRLDLRVPVYSAAGLEALVAAARTAGITPRVHLKVDTGMHRLGINPDAAVELAGAVVGAGFDLEAVWTHFAVADEVDNDFTTTQLERFAVVLEALSAAGVRPSLVHVANSAGALVHPGSRFDLVRSGIAIYGLPPSPQLGLDVDLRPAMSLVSEVAHTQVVRAGEGVSYGLRYRPTRDTVVATVPVGYADGVPRSLAANGGEVLIGGRRCALAGTVTMDMLMVDCGPDADVAPGDEVVLLGEQGGERITAWDWATAVGTIAYEIVCGIGPRVARQHHN